MVIRATRFLNTKETPAHGRSGGSRAICGDDNNLEKVHSTLLFPWLPGWKSTARRNLMEQAKFKDKPRFMKELNGHLAIQHHGANIWFRNFSIIRL